MTGFILDYRINESSHLIDIYENIQIRIADDKRFFWLLLVPQIDGLSQRLQCLPGIVSFLLSVRYL